MIYRAPERATPTRSRAVTHELAALLVGMAIIAAVILQVACAGAADGDGPGRWLCVNNTRLASLRTATAPPTATSGVRSAGILPVGIATPPSPGVIGTPTVAEPGAQPGDPSAGGPFGFRTPPSDPNGLNGAAPILDTPDVGLQDPFAGANAFSERRATMTAQAAEIFEAATASAARRATPEPPSPTSPVIGAGTATPTPTPGPGTPSVTPGPSPSVSATATETGYP